MAVGTPVVQALVDTGLAAGRGAARRTIEEGGVSVNNARVSDVDAVLTQEQAPARAVRAAAPRSAHARRRGGGGCSRARGRRVRVNGRRCRGGDLTSRRTPP
ncbi:hypothetical protein GCM10025868_06090 [Angustibacter aerolatus]|uniref:Tyrosine--tRNA ligase SYY-like C-terminal domain-containing protein n=1 Tax=Angustibacter aerolatus TaxID=1162965 RepID=A0ABQ6JD47_9ACTN|nr:hypothetical protein GCM10025868_06090 [Angustibacter aerolatus]